LSDGGLVCSGTLAKTRPLGSTARRSVAEQPAKEQHSVRGPVASAPWRRPVASALLSWCPSSGFQAARPPARSRRRIHRCRR
jgi:hypothetical protein